MPTSWTCCGPGPARTRRWTASSWTTRRGSMASTGRRAAMEQVDCVVIGAGVVGLAIARALAKAGREVLILESEGAFGTHTSARNSEVIHAGLSYAPGSLKALLSRRGRDLLYAYAAERGIGHRRIGKLIVAVTEDEVAGLRKYRELAAANGVHALVLLDGAGVRA